MEQGAVLGREIGVLPRLLGLAALLLDLLVIDLFQHGFGLAVLAEEALDLLSDIGEEAVLLLLLGLSHGGRLELTHPDRLYHRPGAVVLVRTVLTVRLALTARL